MAQTDEFGFDSESLDDIDWDDVEFSDDPELKRGQELRANAMAALMMLMKQDAKRPKTLVPNPAKVEKATKLNAILNAYMSKCRKMGFDMKLNAMSFDGRNYSFDLFCDEMGYDLKSVLKASMDLVDEIVIGGATEERARLTFGINDLFIEAKPQTK